MTTRTVTAAIHPQFTRFLLPTLYPELFTPISISKGAGATGIVRLACRLVFLRWWAFIGITFVGPSVNYLY
jgi:hypothetical protein